MKKRKLDNFRVWRDRMKVLGKIKSEYPPLKKDGDLAELIGLTLGDGYLGAFPRSEVLRIVLNSKNNHLIQRCRVLIQNVFGKSPTISNRNKSGATNITIYQKKIGIRIGIPVSRKKDRIYPVPSWIQQSKVYSLRYLRGLYEAEGPHSVHKPTSTYKFAFANTNESILKNVYELLVWLGFHPHKDEKRVQLSRKSEVYEAMSLIEFRKY
ncbi:hypothetical protein A3A21_02990 [Candidatus Jorgensenbacteria bacterium RIFCSPLOWO2_01_FULL_45_25b]|uniref:DOD-type homing endonuclease domain-containing protein n=1 Tax=Candidatus Jorgensenbacteria bacterium RIFCSPLOWO2_01_FULL_45_25b TaxID=1798471 RepID=A0A1F6BXK0_9BACT|nr:MAG: hypothetical protein A3A21_02990 [Candidatus Jorgensenbacteria bacterium RIFCSPLOWO2_01_FULL_45_25b]